jgi:dolichyl-phosphate beta-glucosyltransferase
MIDGVSIVIPAFNEELRLPSTLDQLTLELPGICTGPWEIVVSDDGSADRTVAVAMARASSPSVRVLTTDRNRGKGAALLSGVRAARYPLVLFLDADLPVPVPTIAEFVERSADVSLVLGSRRLAGSSVDPPQPLGRRLGGRAFRAVVALFGYDVPSDPQCGVKLLRVADAAPALREVTCRGFAFDVELIERVRRNGGHIVEVPVAWRHVHGSSLRPVRDAIATLRELWLLRRRLPAHVPTGPERVP